MQIYTRLCTCLSTHTTRLQLKRRFAIAISAIIVRIQALPVAANTPVVFNVRCRRAFAHASTKRRCVHNACACKRSYGQAKHFICISSHNPGKIPVCRSKHSPLQTYRCRAHASVVLHRTPCQLQWTQRDITIIEYIKCAGNAGTSGFVLKSPLSKPTQNAILPLFTLTRK
jgi:hypothetical protein